MIRFATSTLCDGPMGRSLDLTRAARANRAEFLSNYVGLDRERAITASLVHGNRVVAVSEKESGLLIPECDGLITKTLNLPLMITTQDCVPVFCWDRKETTIGIFHAGWRGIAAGVVKAGIEAFEESSGAAAEDIFLHFGPAIGPCHYEIQNDVASLFRPAFPESIEELEGKLSLDLHGAVRTQALSSGIPDANTSADPACTFCARQDTDFRYFSWRRDRVRENNMLSAIALIG